jgi:hypothetical protein
MGLSSWLQLTSPLLCPCVIHPPFFVALAPSQPRARVKTKFCWSLGGGETEAYFQSQEHDFLEGHCSLGGRGKHLPCRQGPGTDLCVTCSSSHHSQHQSPLVLLQVQVLQQRDLHQWSLFRELIGSHCLPAAAARPPFPTAATPQSQPGKTPAHPGGHLSREGHGGRPSHSPPP